MVYSPEFKSRDYQTLQTLAENASVIHIVGSIPVPLNVDKPTVIQHGGSIYRENAEVFNKGWNERAVKTVMQCPDLLGLGAENEVWIPYGVDTNFIKPVYNNRNQFLFGHFPSNRLVKGSDDIEEVFEKVAAQIPEQGKHIFGFVGSGGSVSHWQEHLYRLSCMDVYVEALNPTLNGKPYGTWGNAALEAAALGKIVITHSAYEELYAKEFGDHPLRIANTKEALFDHIVELIKKPLPEIQEEMRASRSWVVNKHSLEATAKRWWDKVYKDLFPNRRDEVRDAMKHPPMEGKRTICQVLREINEIGSEEVKTKSLEAMGMAKKMNAKLFDYRSDWDRGLNDSN
jgi:hypothetical protein